MIGFLNGSSDMPFSVSVTNGARFESGLFLGFGIGWDHYSSLDVVPIFAHGTYYIQRGIVTPYVYVYVDAGYSLAWNKGISGANQGGPTFGSGVGLRLADGDGAMPLLQIGCRFQRLRNISVVYYYPYTQYPVTILSSNRENYLYLSIMVGIVF